MWIADDTRQTKPRSEEGPGLRGRLLMRERLGREGRRGSERIKTMRDIALSPPPLLFVLNESI